MTSNRTTPITAVEIENEILRLLELLEAETEAFEELAQDEAEKSSAYKAAWASAYMSKGGIGKTPPVKEREAWSDWQCQTEERDARIADALVKAKRERLHALRTSLDALRTLAANQRFQT